MSEEKTDLEFQKRSEACDQVEARIKEYVDEYEFNDGESSHTPTELESFLIYDAIHGLLADDEFIAKFTAWKALCVYRQAALQESEAGAVYQRQFIPGNWKDVTEEEFNLLPDFYPRRIVYPAPQSAQAIETAAIMKCVEAFKEYAGCEYPEVVEDLLGEILSLIPQAGRTQLEQKCMEVAEEVKNAVVRHHCQNPDLRTIVTNLIGEKK